MGTMYRKIESMILDGPASFDEDFDDKIETTPNIVLSPEEWDVLIKDIAKRCEISEERLMQILAEAGVEARK